MPVGYLLGPTVDFMVSLVVIHLLGAAIVLFLFHSAATHKEIYILI